MTSNALKGAHKGLDYIKNPLWQNTTTGARKTAGGAW